MGKVIALLMICGILASAATCVFAEDKPARVKPEQTQQVIALKPATGTLTVNDFHVKLKGQVQRPDQGGILKWLSMQISDFDPTQIHCSQQGTKEVRDAGDGWTELVYTFPDTVLTPTQGMSFGYAINGGTSISDYNCYWTYDGEPVKSLPKVVTEKKVEADKPKSMVKNLSPAGVAIARKIGENNTKPTIAQLAQMPTLPDEQVVDPIPFNIPSFATAEIEWPEPPLEPGVVSRTYYKRTFFTTDGTKVEYTEAFTIQVIPEPSTCLGLAAGLLGLAGVIRRKK
jgi:hypothetical protein